MIYVRHNLQNRAYYILCFGKAVLYIILLIASLESLSANTDGISPLPFDWQPYNHTELLQLYADLKAVDTDLYYIEIVAEHITRCCLADADRLYIFDGHSLEYYLAEWFADPNESQTAELHDLLVQHFYDQFDFTDWSVDQMQQLIRVADRLAVSEKDINAWWSMWVDANDGWRAGSPAEMIRLIRSVEQCQFVRDKVVAHTLKRLEEDTAWLAASLRTSLLQVLRPYLDSLQLITMRHALTEGLVANDAAWADLSLAQFERLRQIGTQVRVSEGNQIAWLYDWLVLGSGWKGELPNTLALVLHMLDINVQVADIAPARTAILDYMLVQAKNKPQWMNSVCEGSMARFVVYVAQALRLDPKYGDGSSTLQALALLLNTLSPTAESDDNLIARGGLSTYKLYQMWYGGYQLHACGGSPSWGEGESEQTEWIAEMIYMGLRSGRIEPRPATLYLLGQHYDGIDQINEWKQYLDQKIKISAEGSKASIGWLLGRAYAEEITDAQPDPLAGEPWLRVAMDFSPEDETRLHIVQLLALKYLAADKTRLAEDLLDECETTMKDSMARARLGRLQAVIHEKSKYVSKGRH